VLLLRHDRFCGRLVLPRRGLPQSAQVPAPTLGGIIFYGIGIYALTYYGHASHAEGKEYLGLTLPLWFGGIGMVLGFVLMLFSRLRFREFFARKTEKAPLGLLDLPVEHAPAHLMGPGAAQAHLMHQTPTDGPGRGEPPRV
jgi:hypothetical protein